MALEIDLENKLVKLYIMVPNMQPIVVERAFISAYDPREVVLAINADNNQQWYMAPAAQCVFVGTGPAPAVSDVVEAD